MKDKILIKVCDASDGGFYACCKVKDYGLVEAGGESLNRAVENLKANMASLGISTDYDFKVLYFGDANINSIYLSDEEGITSTSANYLANLAQEVIQEKKLSIENISFLNSKIVTPLCPQGLDYGKANFDLDKLEETIDEIAKFNTFCAWVREGIKAKDAMKTAIKNIGLNKWIEIFDKHLPNLLDFKSNLRHNESSVLSLGEQYNFLKSEAFASTYGKLIHPDSPISNARKALQNKTVNPVEMTGSGQDLTIYKYEPAATIEEVDKSFMRLQNRQREAEKELNHLKVKKEKAQDDMEIEKSKLIMECSRALKSELSKFSAEYDADMAMIRECISNLKIILPESLKETYEYLNNLGK